MNNNIKYSVNNNMIINNKNSLINIDYSRLSTLNNLSNRYINKNISLKAEEK